MQYQALRWIQVSLLGLLSADAQTWNRPGRCHLGRHSAEVCVHSPVLMAPRNVVLILLLMNLEGQFIVL